MAKISRRHIAEAWARELVAGRDVTRQVAAYLVETGRTREAELIVRDTETALVEHGVVVADVASARDLSPEARKSITAFLKQSFDADSLALRESVDSSLIGGVVIDAAGERLDASIRGRISQLKSSKI